MLNIENLFKSIESKSLTIYGEFEKELKKFEENLENELKGSGKSEIEMKESRSNFRKWYKDQMDFFIKNTNVKIDFSC